MKDLSSSGDLAVAGIVPFEVSDPAIDPLALSGRHVVALQIDLMVAFRRHLANPVQSCTGLNKTPLGFYRRQRN